MKTEYGSNFNNFIMKWKQNMSCVSLYKHWRKLQLTSNSSFFSCNCAEKTTISNFQLIPWFQKKKKRKKRKTMVWFQEWYSNFRGKTTKLNFQELNSNCRAREKEKLYLYKMSEAKSTTPVVLQIGCRQWNRFSEEEKHTCWAEFENEFEPEDMRRRRRCRVQHRRRFGWTWTSSESWWWREADANGSTHEGKERWWSVCRSFFRAN